MAISEYDTLVEAKQFLDIGRVTFAELEVAKIVILDSFKDNLTRYKLLAEHVKSLDNTDSEHISILQYENVKTFFLLLYFEGRMYSLFTPVNLSKIANDIFTNDAIRDFVLNWTDMAMVSLNVQDYSVERLIETISRGVCQNKLSETNGGDNSLSLVNNKVAVAIQISPDYVQSALKANSWLLCIVVLYLFMSEINISDMV